MQCAFVSTCQGSTVQFSIQRTHNTKQRVVCINVTEQRKSPWRGRNIARKDGDRHKYHGCSCCYQEPTNPIDAGPQVSSQGKSTDNTRYTTFNSTIVSGIYYIIHVYLSITHTTRVCVSAVPMNVPHRLRVSTHTRPTYITHNTLRVQKGSVVTCADGLLGGDDAHDLNVLTGADLACGEQGVLR